MIIKAPASGATPRNISRYPMGTPSKLRGCFKNLYLVLALLVLICCISLQPLRAQQVAEQSQQIMQSYEGQNVSTIELAGRPDLDVSKYGSLLEQKQGQPFSTQQIEASVEALRKTGDFQDVVLDLRPETTGVRVIFVLKPAYYLAIYDFPGALKVFSYSRLIQVANYTAQEPYSTVDIHQAQVGLEKFFHQAGFFEATVHPEIRLNQQHRIVNVYFNTDLKRRARFGAVDLTGSTPEQTAYLEKKIHSFLARLRGAQLKAGKPYSSHKIQLATTYLQGALAKEQRLAAEVKFVAADYHPSTGVADVTFHIEAGPKVELRVTGARIWPWSRKSLIPIYTENSIDDEVIQEGRTNLLSYFQAKGFYDATVQANVERNPDTTLITYAITKNQKHKVEKVSVQGNVAFPDKDLLNHSDVEKAHLFSHGKYSEQLLRKSVSNLKAVYLNAGYSEVKVTPRVTRDHGNIVVAYIVDEGPRDFVQELQIVGNNTVPVNQLAPKGLMLGPNRPYSPQLEQQDRNAITAQYLLNGYLTASVTSKTQPIKGDPHHVIVTYTIHEGPKVSTAQLVIVGKQHTRSDLITTTTNIKVGRPLSEAELLTSESRLYNLGIFDWAEVDPKRAITDQTSEDVLIKVHESKRNVITYGFGFEVINRGGSLPSGTVSVPGIPPVGLPQGFRTSQTTYYGPRGTFEYTRRNVRGTAESYTFAGFAGRLDQRASAIYTDPFFRGSSWSSSYLLSFEHDSENPVFTSREGSSVIQFSKFLDAKKTKTVFLRYNFKYTDISQIFPGLEFLVPVDDRRVRLSTFSGSWVQDTRDNILDAHKGIYKSVELGITPSALGSSVDFARFVGQISHYKNLGHGIIWANNLRVGLEQPFNGSHVPISEEFFTGGGSTLRGFPLNGAGPQQYTTVCGNASDPSTCGPITVPTGGNELLIVNSEFRIPIDMVKKGLGIVPFYDGGNVFQHVGFRDFTTNCNAASTTTTGSITVVTPSCFTSSVGIGLRYATPIGPVRIDLGHNLNNITGIKSTQFFITLGQAF